MSWRPPIPGRQPRRGLGWLRADPAASGSSDPHGGLAASEPFLADPNGGMDGQDHDAVSPGLSPAEAVLERAAELPRPAPGGEIEHLLRVIAAAGPTARVVELIAANAGDGTSTAVCNLARAKCNVTEGAVLLIDLEAGQSRARRQQRARRLGVAESDLIDLGLLASSPGELLSRDELSSFRLRLYRVAAENLFLAERLAINEPLSDEARQGSLTPDLLRQYLREQGFSLPTMAEPAEHGLLPSLSQLFSTVFVDAPALSTSLDGLLAAGRVDAVILVLAAEETRVAVARSLRDRIAEAGGTIIGAILNKRRYYIPKVLYDRL